MHLQVILVSKGYSFDITVVYAFNQEERRRNLWKQLMQLKGEQPWLVMGDFNDILMEEDRIGARARSKPGIEFRNCVEQCGLEDIQYSGNRYTWNNKQLGEERICSKIDRIMANEEWKSNFENAEAVFFKEGYFDHSPAVLFCSPKMITGKKVFKYFEMWSTHPRFKQVVKEIWEQRIEGTKMYLIVVKLKALKMALYELNRQEFSQIQCRDEEVVCEFL